MENNEALNEDRMEIYQLKNGEKCDLCKKRITEKTVVFRRIFWGGRSTYIHIGCMGQYFDRHRNLMSEYISHVLDCLSYCDPDDIPEWPDEL